MAVGTHPVQLDDDALFDECEFERLKHSGPGGQRRNKVETGVRLRHRPTGLRGEAFESRSAEANRRAALDRLRRRLAVEIRRPAGDAPSPLWRSRVARGRILINPDHADLPRLVAEALDVLAAEQWHVANAADRLDTTASQLVKLLHHLPESLARLNRERGDAGLPPLKR